MTLHENEIVVDESVVDRLLRAQRPALVGLEIVSVGGGTDNTMYRIGADHLVRLPRTPAKVASLTKELTWLPRLRPRLALTIPTPVYAGRPDSSFPLPWAIYTWIEGAEVSTDSITDWPAYGRDLAGFVARLHATDLMGATRGDDLSWYRGGLLHPNDDWITTCFADARALGAELDVDRLERRWRRDLDLPHPADPHVWLHGDLRPTNVLVQHGSLHAVIDFGALSVGFPDAEHAVVWDLPAPARDSYRAVLDIDEHTWERARAWAIAVGISGVSYYWHTYPAFLAECLRRLRTIADDDLE